MKIKSHNLLFLKIILFLGLISSDENDIEEVVITGSLLGEATENISPTEIITDTDFNSLNITNLAEISKYLNISSGSRFQSNTLGGVDQGMASITLRGLDHASTLLLINSKRHTFAEHPPMRVKDTLI